MEKLSYYDTLADLLPGVIFLWGISVLGPASAFKISLVMTGNTIIDSILFVALAFVVGHLIQILSRYLVQPILKKAYWHGYFFSDIYLVPAFNKCSKVEFERIMIVAQHQLKIPEPSLSILRKAQVIEEKEELKSATQVSAIIYRLMDARTQDEGLALKAHTQNIFYSLFRNLSTLFMILFVLNLIAGVSRLLPITPNFCFVSLFDFVAFISFFVRARTRGELYVKGLFWSGPR